MIDFVFKLIENHLKDEKIEIRDSVISAFGSILDTIHQTKIAEILEGAIVSLIPMLANDISSDVRASICWSFKKICQNNTKNLLDMNPDTVNNFIKSLLAFLNMENPKTNKKMISLICDSFDNLIKNQSTISLNEFKVSCSTALSILIESRNFFSLIIFWTFLK